MHSTMVWKNRACFSLFCLLEMLVGFRGSKSPHMHNADDSLPKLRRFVCLRIRPTALLAVMAMIVPVLAQAVVPTATTNAATSVTG